MRRPDRTYGWRCPTETVVSSLKRNMGGTLSARTYRSQAREIRLPVLPHNLAIFCPTVYSLREPAVLPAISLQAAGLEHRMDKADF